MYGDKRILAVIPARGGSKRLPNKNIKELCGKPLITWSVEAGLKSKYIDKLIVSTDSDEIARVSRKSGADVPFIRPDYLGTDSASSFDVIKHSIEFLGNDGEHFDYLVLLQPTSPLRTTEDIDLSIEELFRKKANSVTSVCEVDHSPLWSNTLPKSYSMNNFIRKSVRGKNSQELKTYYRINGAVYVCLIKSLLEEKSFISKSKSFAYIMDKKKSVDIDTELDFIIAETILKNHLD